MTLPADEQAIRDLPVQPYIGRTLAEAQDYAEAEGRQVRVLDSLAGPRRMDLVPRRVNVELGSDGRVVAADAG